MDVRICVEITQIYSSQYSMHSVEKREILSPHRKNISSNQLFSNFFSKTVTFTEFLPKMREREFRQIKVLIKEKELVSRFF